MRSARNQASASPPPSSIMAGLAQSFVPPSHLNSYHRPGMPARSVSNMSECSVTSTASQQSTDGGDLTSSRPTTPSAPSTSTGEKAPPAKLKSASALETGSGIRGFRSNLSRPIAIEVPKMTRLSSAPVYTPPEPLSARGDLPGGYFPLHEDPKSRVRRTHPFQPRSSEAADRQPDNKRQPQPTVFGSYMNQASHLAATPYLVHGSHENHMPLGKYYPTNYEKRKSLQSSGRTITSSSSSSSCSKQSQTQSFGDRHTSHCWSAEPNDDSMRRKMQKYQHDIMTQTAKALGNTAAANAPRPAAGIILSDMALNLAHAASQKSLPPRPDLSKSPMALNDESRARSPQPSSEGADVHAPSMQLNQMAANQFSSPSGKFVTSTGTQTMSDESQRKAMQQQQQEIAQAAAEAALPSTNMLLNDLSVYLNHAVSTSPVSPKLIPLGSPGPVTPMELESSASRVDGCQSIDGRLGRSRRRAE